MYKRYCGNSAVEVDVLKILTGPGAARTYTVLRYVIQCAAYMAQQGDQGSKVDTL